MFKCQMRERNCCIPQGLLELLVFVLVRYSITTPRRCHKYHHPCTIANRTLVLLSVTDESPHGAASGCVLPLSCHHLLACGSSATCTSPFQRIEAKVAAAGLSHLPLPASNQTSVQGQSCCGSRYRSDTSWKRTVRKRAVTMQLVFHLKCVCGMKTSCTCGVHMGTDFSSQENWTIGKQRDIS